MFKLVSISLEVRIEIMNEKFTNEMIIHVKCVIRYFVELDDMNHTFSNSLKAKDHIFFLFLRQAQTSRRGQNFVFLFVQATQTTKNSIFLHGAKPHKCSHCKEGFVLKN